MNTVASNGVVLIVTHSEDNECIDFVTEAIHRRGGAVVRFDTDLFPTETRLAVHYDGNREEMRLITPAGEIDLNAVTAVWHRRLAFGRQLPEAMEPHMRNACRQESRATAMGMLSALRAFHLDPEADIRRAENKQLQLRVARDVGLEIPRTLITNDPESLRRFALDTPGGVVAKMLSSFAVYEGEKEKVVFTTVLTPEHLEDLDGLDWSPMTFQERVEKKVELRVTVAGDHVLAASIDSPSEPGAEADWRRRGPELIDSWEPYTLPGDIRERILRFMDVFRLNYGALDFILTPGGRHVFLEINPVGEFFWLDTVTDPPISDALAEVLLGTVRRRERALQVG